MSQSTTPRTYSERFREAFAQVGGEPEAEFTLVPFRSLLAVFLAQVVLFLICGGALSYWVGLTDGSATLISIGIVSVGLGAFIASRVPSMCGESVLVCPDGLVWQRLWGVETCRWKDLKHIQRRDQASYSLVRKDGGSWQLDGKNMDRLSEWDRILRARADQHAVAWDVE